MSTSIEQLAKQVYTDLFWECNCDSSLPFIHLHSEEQCPACQSFAEDQANAEAVSVLVNASRFNLDPEAVNQVRAELAEVHPLLVQAIDMGLDPYEQVLVVRMQDVIFELKGYVPTGTPDSKLKAIIQEAATVAPEWELMIHWLRCKYDL